MIFQKIKPAMVIERKRVSALPGHVGAAL